MSKLDAEIHPTLEMDRLSAIAAGTVVAAEIHPKLQDEELILQVNDFNLWYGEKQVLFDNILPVAKGKVTALIGPSGCRTLG